MNAMKPTMIRSVDKFCEKQGIKLRKAYHKNWTQQAPIAKMKEFSYQKGMLKSHTVSIYYYLCHFSFRL